MGCFDRALDFWDPNGGGLVVFWCPTNKWRAPSVPQASPPHMQCKGWSRGKNAPHTQPPGLSHQTRMACFGAPCWVGKGVVHRFGGGRGAIFSARATGGSCNVAKSLPLVRVLRAKDSPTAPWAGDFCAERPRQRQGRAKSDKKCRGCNAVNCVKS